MLNILFFNISIVKQILTKKIYLDNFELYRDKKDVSYLFSRDHCRMVFLLSLSSFCDEEKHNQMLISPKCKVVSVLSGISSSVPQLQRTKFYLITISQIRE